MKKHRWIECHIFCREDDEDNFASVPTKAMDYWIASNFAKKLGKTKHLGINYRSSKDPEILKNYKEFN